MSVKVASNNPRIPVERGPQNFHDFEYTYLVEFIRNPVCQTNLR